MRTLAPRLATALGALALGCASPGSSDAAIAVGAVAPGSGSRTLLAPVPGRTPGPLMLDGVLDGAGDEGLGLDELVRRYEEATGRKVTVDESFPVWAAKRRTLAVGGTSVPAEAVQATFETLLDRMGCVLVRRGAGTSSELHLTVPDAETDGWLRAVALPIPLSRVEDAHAHSALLVATVVELPSSDVLLVCSEMMRTDEISAVGELVPLEDTRSVLVLGPGRRVARRVAILRAIDAAYADRAAAEASR